MSNKENINKLRHHPYFAALLDIVRKSGRIILDIYNDHDPKVLYKEDKSPLTKADLLSHNLICKELSTISDIPIVSEESDEHYTKALTYWLIDPLDGTKEFLNKNDEFTVNIALIEDHVPIIGIVYLPVSGFIYIGGQGLGSVKIDNSNNLKEIKVSIPDKKIKVIASSSHLNNETKNFIKSLGKVDLIQSGSSIKFCLVAEGLVDIYPRLSPTSEWDTAAAQAVVEGAGGSVLTLDAKRLRYQKHDIINPKFIVRGQNFLGI